MTRNRPSGSAVILLGLFVASVGLEAAFAAEPGSPSPISEFRIPPTRIIWQSAAGVAHADTLLAPRPGQPVLEEPLPPCTLAAAAGEPSAILLDFGREIQGHVELFTPMAPSKDPVRVRIRFGESAAEAMADLGDRNAGNDHAVRDETVMLPWLGTKTVGPSGFRFVRIDAVDPDRPVRLSQVRAVLGVRDLPRIGSFRCSDPRLERIWEVGADTVHLCMQDYLWDGIKRDRLVWIGDMHPEVATIHAVFGANDVVPKSLDLTRDVTPVTAWMNGISSYSMWWVLIHEDLWLHQGDRDYLAAQQPYLGQLLERLAALVGPDGHEQIDGMRFLDWPSSANQQGVTAGLQGLLVMALESGARLMDVLGEDRVAGVCRTAADRAKRVVPETNGSKAGAALLVLAGMKSPEQTAHGVLLPGEARGVSTFYGLYVLEALARADQIDPALELIRTYWGGMLDLGATTFWEDFDLAWTTNAARIDELVPPGKKDIHGDFGAYCYEGFRHSLCHGWASGPTSWLSRHVLGITPLEPGFARVRIAPRLGSLAWAEGSYPTPRGPILVRHERQPDGTVRTSCDAPQGIAVELVGATLVAEAGARSVDEPLEASASGGTGLRVQRLQCEWLVNPHGIVTRRPRLSWIVTSPERDQRQTAYRILSATRPELLEPGSADLWDSGLVESGETLGIDYAGKPVGSGQRVHWRVQTFDRAGRPSAWSEPAEWTMGLFAETDWQAEWISAADATPLHSDRDRLHLPPARQYRKEFRLTKPVTRAVFHGTALGIVDWSLDGCPVSDSRFEPGWTDYRLRVPSRTHDVTDLLAATTDGRHCLAAVVADGWYAGYVGYGLLVGYGPHRTGRNIYGTTPAIRGQLMIDYTDGSRESIITDSSWHVTDAGPVREADLLMGETYDARMELPGWNRAGYVMDEGIWKQAVPAAANSRHAAPFFEPGTQRQVTVGFVKPPVIDGYAAPPIRVTEELPALSVREQSPGVFIFDLGQNFAGVARLKVSAAAGTRIGLRFGEMLHPDGRLMTENLRRARATDTYVCKGDGVETWTPRFTYHGFQFVEVTGLPAGAPPPLETVTGLVLHNDTPLVGRFACSDAVLTRFWKNTQWTQRANFIEVPTDCPQRDERLGWMGDAQIYARTATFNADVAAFFTKWLADVREAQVADGDAAGAYTDYAPYPFAHGKPGAVFGAAWTDAGVICPWTMWRVYGDIRVVEDHWASLGRFMAWRARLDPDLIGVEAGNTWGDWLNVDEPTPIPFIDLCYHAQSARMMAELAAALGKPAEAAEYRRRLNDLAASFVRQHFRADDTISIDSQTACVLALQTGLVPSERVDAVVRQLVELIERAGFRMRTGFLGTKSLLAVLSAHGHHDLACRLFQSREFPSWGYEVEQGANTVWERWDSFTKEHGFEGMTGSNNAAMNSFSHYAFGAVMEWAFRDLAGIDTLEPGYGRILIRPGIPHAMSNPAGHPLDWVEADYAGPRGRISSRWERTAAGIVVRVSVPANTTAEIRLPASDPRAVSEGGEPLTVGQAGIRGVRIEAAELVVDAGSGDYVFSVDSPSNGASMPGHGR